MSARTATLLCCLLASIPATGAADVIKIEFMLRALGVAGAADLTLSVATWRR